MDGDPQWVEEEAGVVTPGLVPDDTPATTATPGFSGRSTRTTVRRLVVSLKL